MKSYLQGHLKRLLDGIFKLDQSKGENNSLNWDGTVTLKALPLDPNLFTFLNLDTVLPLKLIRGCIDELSISVPWLYLGRDSVSFKAKNCFALLRLDMSDLYNFDKRNQNIRKKKILEAVERRVVDTFKQLQQKKSTYIENFLLSMLKTCQADIENLRIKVEIVEFEEIVGGIELVFNELKYENSVTAIANTSLQNTQETNGLRIVDLRLKSLSKDKLLLLKYSEAEITSSKLSLQQFKDLFKNEDNPKYIVAPILLQFNFSRLYEDESKKQYTRFVQFEVSPILLGVSNDDLKLANAILNCYQLTQEYGYAGRIVLPYSLRTGELNAAFDRHRLLRALTRCVEIKTLRKKTAKLVEAFRTLKTEYEFGYEIKILHLMEKQFDKDTEKLYQKNMIVNVPFKDNAECTVDDLIARIEELEKGSRLEVILALRDNVMERLRNQGHFKKVLLERKAAIKAKQEKGTGVISDLLRKGISGILGSKKEAKHFDDFITDIEQSETALQAKLNTAATRIGSILEVNCPSMMLSLTRNGKILLELALTEVKYKESEQVDNEKLSSRLSVAEALLLDEVKAKYAVISSMSTSDSKPKATGEDYRRERSNKEKGFEIVIESNLQPHPETGDMRRIMNSLDIVAANIYMNLGKELLSKIVYFTTDFSQLAKKVNSSSHAQRQSMFAPANPAEYTMAWADKIVEPSSLRQKSTFELQMLKLIDLDKKFQSHFSIKIEELAIVCKHSVHGDWVGIYTKPHLKLLKNELSLKLMLFQILHSDNSSNLTPLEKGLQNLSDLDGIKKLIKPTNIRAVLPRRDKNRVSLDVSLDCLQIFLSDEFLLRIVKIGQDFETIKVLNTESMLIDLKKTAKQPTKKPAAKLSNQLMSSRNKIGSITERSIKASRKGSSNTFMTAQSDVMNEEFFDAFEDETDLLAHQELKTRIDLIQSAAIAMNTSGMDLHVIDEDNRYRQDKPAASTNLQSKYKYVNFSMSLKFEDLSLILYSSNELENYIQSYFTKGYIFFDYSKLELQFSECTLILKQNLLTLLNKDILPLFGSINKVVQSVLKKQGGASAQPAEVQDEEKPVTGSNFVTKLGELVTKKPHPVSVSLQLATQISVYLTEQIENMIIPGIFLSVRPMKAKPKAPVQPLAELGSQGLQIKCDVKIDVFNGGEVAYYEPFIEEMLFESTLYFEGEQLKQDILFQNLLLNLKPSILKNLLDTLSTYSTQNIKRSAELHSVMTIRNETGILMSITANSSGKARQLKPFDTVKINLFTSAKTDRQHEQLEGADKTYRDSDLSINGVCYFKNRESVLKLIGRVSDDDGGSKQYEVNKTNLNTTSYFGKKRLVLELESFGKQLNIDLSNMTDTEFQLSDYVFLVAKVESLRDQTLLTLTSNLKITNKLEHDVETSIYLRKTVVSKEDFGKTFTSKVKKRRGSGVFSDGDHLSDNMSVDFNEPMTGNTFTFPNTSNSVDPKALQSSGVGFKFGLQVQDSAEKEERSSLVFRSIVRSGGSIFLPLLKNFPVNYYMITIPATESFFHSISKHPSLEYNRVKTQNEKSNRIYFDELMRKDCGITSHQLEHSVATKSYHRSTIDSTLPINCRVR